MIDRYELYDPLFLCIWDYNLALDVNALLVPIF